MKIRSGKFTVKLSSFFIFCFVFIMLIYSNAAFAGGGGISLEAGERGETTTTATQGNLYISDIEFDNLMKKADELLKYGKFDQTLALLNPYEVYLFGSLDHWSNMARYNWRLSQAYALKCDGINYLFYLKTITDTSIQPKPTKHKVQYLATVDENNVETGKYYFGAALKSVDFGIRQAALDKIELMKQSFQKIEAKMDARMKYDNYPGSRSRRTRGN